MFPPNSFNPIGKAKGRRIIIGGASPHQRELSKTILDNNIVIGVNQWPIHDRCDYWICADTRIIYEKAFYYAEAAKKYNAVRLFSRSGDINGIPETFADSWFDEIEDAMDPRLKQKTWNQALRFKYSSAVSAVHLAWLMQPRDIVLYGVDFLGCSRYDGVYSWCWDECVDEISQIFEAWHQTIPIYKTNPASRLNLPLLLIN